MYEWDAESRGYVSTRNGLGLTGVTDTNKVKSSTTPYKLSEAEKTAIRDRDSGWRQQESPEVPLASSAFDPDGPFKDNRINKLMTINTLKDFNKYMGGEDVDGQDGMNPKYGKYPKMPPPIDIFVREDVLYNNNQIITLLDSLYHIPGEPLIVTKGGYSKIKYSTYYYKLGKPGLLHADPAIVKEALDIIEEYGEFGFMDNNIFTKSSTKMISLR